MEIKKDLVICHSSGALDHKSKYVIEHLQKKLILNTGVKRYEEHLLDQDGGVNKDIGYTCSQPNSNASDITIFNSIGKSYN